MSELDRFVSQTRAKTVARGTPYVVAAVPTAERLHVALLSHQTSSEVKLEECQTISLTDLRQVSPDPISIALTQRSLGSIIRATYTCTFSRYLRGALANNIDGVTMSLHKCPPVRRCKAGNADPRSAKVLSGYRHGRVGLCGSSCTRSAIKASAWRSTSRGVLAPDPIFNNPFHPVREFHRFLDDNAGMLGMSGAVTNMRAKELFETLDHRRAFALPPAPSDFHVETINHQRHRLSPQGALVAEMIPQETVFDTASSGDVSHRGCVEPSLGEEGERCVEDRRAGLLGSPLTSRRATAGARRPGLRRGLRGDGGTLHLAYSNMTCASTATPAPYGSQTIRGGSGKMTSSDQSEGTTSIDSADAIEQVIASATLPEKVAMMSGHSFFQQDRESGGMWGAHAYQARNGIERLRFPYSLSKLTDSFPEDPR